MTESPSRKTDKITVIWILLCGLTFGWAASVEYGRYTHRPVAFDPAWLTGASSVPSSVFAK